MSLPAGCGLQPAQHLQRACFSGAPDSPPGTAGLDLFRWRTRPGASDGGIGGDDAVQAQVQRQAGDVVDVLIAEVRGDLDQQRNVAAGRFVCFLPHGRQQRPQGLHVLQQPEPRRVRGADVDHEVVGGRREAAGADEVVLHGVLELHHLALADVHADHGTDLGVPALQGGPGGLEPGRHGGGAVVVESHPVDDGPVLDEPEQPRLLVAGLGLAGDGADLDVAEAEFGQGLDAVAFLVEAGGEAERRRERQAEGRGLQRRAAGR